MYNIPPQGIHDCFSACAIYSMDFWGSGACPAIHKNLQKKGYRIIAHGSSNGNNTSKNNVTLPPSHTHPWHRRNREKSRLALMRYPPFSPALEPCKRAMSGCCVSWKLPPMPANCCRCKRPIPQASITKATTKSTAPYCA